MEILYFTYPLSATLIFIMAIGLGVYLTQKFKLSWKLYLIGAATFVFSQIGHIPFNAVLSPLLDLGARPLIFQALFLGLSAGLWEELSRYAAYRWAASDARSWGKGLLLGAGHGGIEALIVGGLILITYLNMVILRGMGDLSTLVPADQLEGLQQSLEAYWANPWYLTVMGAVERALTIPAHLTFSILVLQTFLRKQARWLWFSVALHTLLNAAAVYTAVTWGIFASEAALALITVFNIFVIFKLRTPEPEAEEAPPLPDFVPVMPVTDPEETPENLDRSRFQS